MRKVKQIGSATLSFLTLLAVSSSPALAQAINFQPQIVPAVNITNVVSAVINLLFIVAAVIAVVFLIWGGIRWILSGGDKAGVESARNTIIAAIIGLVIVFLSFVILTFVFNFLGINLGSGFNLPNVTNPNIR